MANTKFQRLQASRALILAQIRSMQEHPESDRIEEHDLFIELGAIEDAIRATDPRLKDVSRTS